ncbi:MAG: hypothetical protein QXJ68_05700 [Methanocellales archaeon]
MRKWILATFVIFILALFIIYLPLFFWYPPATGPAELPSIAIEDINISILTGIALLVLLIILLLLLKV